MSALVGVFLVSLLASFLFTKYEEKLQTTQNLFGGFKPMSDTSDSSRYQEDLYHKTFFDSFHENVGGSLGGSLKDVADLDVCFFMVVTRNQQYCMEQNEGGLNRLTILMMHCQLKPEASLPQKCTPEMAFSECVSKMDEQDRATFATLKKRALTVCQEVSQLLFLHNGQRHVEALQQTTRLHVTFLTSFKENQKLLQNITSQTLARIQVQQRHFFKNMRSYRADFTKTQNVFSETVKVHTTLLVEQRKIASGLEQDINALTEGFVLYLESVKNNFSELSKNVFEKHSKIMVNLERIEESTDKILAQFERFKEFDQTTILDEMFSWIEEISQPLSVGKNSYGFMFLSLALLISTVYFKMSTSVRRAVFVLIVAWSLATWNYLLPFVFLGFVPAQ